MSDERPGHSPVVDDLQWRTHRLLAEVAAMREDAVNTGAVEDLLVETRGLLTSLVFNTDAEQAAAVDKADTLNAVLDAALATSVKPMWRDTNGLSARNLSPVSSTSTDNETTPPTLAAEPAEPLAFANFAHSCDATARAPAATASRSAVDAGAFDAFTPPKELATLGAEAFSWDASPERRVGEACGSTAFETSPLSSCSVEASSKYLFAAATHVAAYRGGAHDEPLALRFEHAIGNGGAEVFSEPPTRSPRQRDDRAAAASGASTGDGSGGSHVSRVWRMSVGADFDLDRVEDFRQTPQGSTPAASSDAASLSRGELRTDAADSWSGDATNALDTAFGIVSMQQAVGRAVESILASSSRREGYMDDMQHSLTAAQSQVAAANAATAMITSDLRRITEHAGDAGTSETAGLSAGRAAEYPGGGDGPGSARDSLETSFELQSMQQAVQRAVTAVRDCEHARTEPLFFEEKTSDEVRGACSAARTAVEIAEVAPTENELRTAPNASTPTPHAVVAASATPEASPSDSTEASPSPRSGTAVRRSRPFDSSRRWSKTRL